MINRRWQWSYADGRCSDMQSADASTGRCRSAELSESADWFRHRQTAVTIAYCYGLRMWIFGHSMDRGD